MQAEQRMENKHMGNRLHVRIEKRIFHNDLIEYLIYIKIEILA